MSMYHLAMLERTEVRDFIPAVPQAINPTVPDGRWRAWLAKQAVWVLNRLEVKHQPPPETVKRVQYASFDDEDIFRELHLGRREIASIWRGEVKYIVCGRDYWERLTRRTDCHPFAMDVHTRLGDGGEVRVMGLRLVVLPWIEGMALLPELSEVR